MQIMSCENITPEPKPTELSLDQLEVFGTWISVVHIATLMMRLHLMGTQLLPLRLRH